MVEMELVMRITKEELIADDSILGHMVLHGLGKQPGVATAIARVGHADVALLVDGHEVDPRSFVDAWQAQVGRMIDEEARRKADAALESLRNIFGDLEDRMRQHVRRLTPLAGFEGDGA